MRRNQYWKQARRAGESDADFAWRCAQVYLAAQRAETAAWWARIGVAVPLDGRRVLDLGSGYGALSVDAARRGAASVVGVDTDAGRVTLARRHLATIEDSVARRVRFHAGSVQTLPDDERFDVVLSKDTFEHVEHLEAMLAAIAARLSPGGMLVSGFSPLYYSPNGDHLRFGLPLPWLHVVLPSRWLFRRAARLSGRPVSRWEDVGLNRLTLPGFQALMAAGPWEPLSLRVNPQQGRLMPAVEALRRVPPLARYFTIGVYAVYRRTADGAAGPG